MPEDDERRQIERSAELIRGGSDLAAASVGAAVGLIGGPAGAFGGAAAGVAATRVFRKVGEELQLRLMGPRQHVRAGAAYSIAAKAIAERLDAGDIPRSDGFFEETEGRRSPAEELLEGVLQAAADSYEEQKVEFIGRLYASLAFSDAVGRAHANFLIGLARALTFRQLALMAVIWEGDAASRVTAAAQENPPRQLLFSDELGLEVDELERLGLVGRGQPGGTSKRSGMTFVDASSVAVSELTLTAMGRRLYDLMSLSDVSTLARQEVLTALWRVGT